MPRLALALLLLLTASLSGPATGQAQDQAQTGLRSPILVVDFEELFQISNFGQRIQSDLDVRRRVLSDEIAAIDAEMAKEERDLTQQRTELSPEAFRRLADAFDAKVQRLRAEQDEKAVALNRYQTEEQLRFRQVAFPIVGQLMLESGALVVMEKRSLVVFNDVIDVTEVIARRLDAATMAGPAEEGAAEDAPATDDGAAAPDTPPAGD